MLILHWKLCSQFNRASLQRRPYIVQLNANHISFFSDKMHGQFWSRTNHVSNFSFEEELIITDISEPRFYTLAPQATFPSFFHPSTEIFPLMCTTTVQRSPTPHEFHAYDQNEPLR